jgi:hypothetical protein
MKLNQIEARLPAWYAASVEPDGPSFYLTSKPGRGKSSVLREAPRLLEKAFGDGNYGFVCLNGACLTLATASGYLWPVEGAAGATYSRFTRPDWWMTKENKPLEDYVGGVILIDEEDKLGLDEKKIVGEAALSKRFASHQLPDGWVVWFAGNGSGDRSGSTKKFDHLINRRNEIKIDDDIVSWLDWARTKGSCLPETMVFAEENPHIVFQDAPEVQGPWCTPRSLSQQDIYLRGLMGVFGTDMIPIDPTTIEEVAGGIGSGAAAQLFNTIRLGQELPSYQEILANAGTIRVPVKPDAMRLAAYKMAAQVKAEEAKQVITYIGRFPDEFQVIFAKMAVSRHKALVVQKDFAAWCGKNSGLLAVLGQFGK